MMLWLMILLGALSPSDSLTSLAKDRHAMKQLRGFKGGKSCNKSWVLKRSNSKGDLCRMALLASAAADGRSVRKSSKKYEAMAVRRGAYLVEAIEFAEKAAKKLTAGKRVANQKFVKATRAISEVCPLVDSLRQEAAMAPLSAPQARNLSSKLTPKTTGRQATCRCINALRLVSSRAKSSKAFVLAARETVSLSGCVTKRLEVARATQYVAPRRSRFSKAGRADQVTEGKRIAPPSREKAARNIVERHRNEINACAAEARKLGGNRLKRSKRMKRCICSTAKGWRFAPGAKLTLEEEAKSGTLVLRLDIGKTGRVKTCGVIVKK
jgi:hypothetical protein